jgi:hypothetical protein
MARSVAHTTCRESNYVPKVGPVRISAFAHHAAPKLGGILANLRLALVYYFETSDTGSIQLGRCFPSRIMEFVLIRSFRLRVQC